MKNNIQEKGLLRFSTAGSVDDGKSTLIGRLLYDSKSVFEDQLAAISKTGMKNESGQVNLALLTDGLRAEREQGITIDVAYRYFATPQRKFIIADTPGHIQYTRNMITGASTSQLSVILVDARKGIVEQTKRHSFIASLLGMKHIVYCINKMDLVDYDKAAFIRIKKELEDFTSNLSYTSIFYVPISALVGDNIVSSSLHMPWYTGSTVLQILEQVDVGMGGYQHGPRLSVQTNTKPGKLKSNHFGNSGMVAGGAFSKGDEVFLLPYEVPSKIIAITSCKGAVESVGHLESCTIRLENDVRLDRGDMIVPLEAKPRVSTKHEVILCWMNEKPLQVGKTYTIQHATRETTAVIEEVQYKLDINTLDRLEDATEVCMNDIVSLQLSTLLPLFTDPYKDNKKTGSLILVDPDSYETLGAGIITTGLAKNGNDK